VGVVLLLFATLFNSNSYNTSLAQTEQEQDLSLFSADITLSQQDYKKENCVGLAEDSFKNEIDKGTVLAVNNPDATDLRPDATPATKITETDDTGEAQERKEATQYLVKNGDTLSTISNSFGIKVQTLLWANNLDILSVVHPGDDLTIPPEDGVMYKVKMGDTILAIASKYGTTSGKIKQFNQLDIDNIREGQMLFLPNGKMPAPAPQSALASNNTSERTPAPISTPSSTPTYSSTPAPVIRSGSGGSHRFPYGQCTWYAASRRGGVPWSGNAKDWLYNAPSYGYKTGNTPVPGAVMVTNESWWGHVAYVESVSGNSVTISEMNYAGWGIVSRRTLSKGDYKIRGYIY
jgi:surface antigen